MTLTTDAEPPGPAPEAAWTGSSARKHEAILAAARTVFLRSGYLAANLDSVAQLAGVSKRTVYKHFADKDALFTQVLIDAIGPLDAAVDTAWKAARVHSDLDKQFRALARSLIALVIEPDLMQLRRIVIAEAHRFPAITRAWRERGPGRNVETLAGFFAELTADGELDCPNPVRAAEHFNWLVLGAPINACMFDPEHSFTLRQLNAIADDAARAFLAAYRRR